MKHDIVLPTSDAIVKNIGLGPGGSVQKMFNSSLASSSDRFTPFRQGYLSGNAKRLDPQGMYIDYNSPYARYLWYGKLMVDPKSGKGSMFSQDFGFWSRPGVPKQLTDKDLKFSGAPIRGPRWVERAFEIDGDQIIKGLERYVNGGSK